MNEADSFRGVSGSGSGKKTKKVNVFDQTPRQIRCAEKTHDYLGDGNLIMVRRHYTILQLEKTQQEKRLILN